MDYINKENLDYLLEKRSDNCVSIYIPTHKYGRKVQ